MPLPILPFLTGMLGRMVAGLGSGIRGATIGMVGREAMRSGTGGSVARLGLAGMAAASGKSIPAPVLGGLARDFTAVGKSIASLPALIRDWSGALVDAKSSLSAFSGTIASAMGQLEADRMGRTLSKARNIGPDVARATQNQSRLESATAPWSTAVEMMDMRIKSAITGAVAELIESFNKTPLVREILKWIGVKEEENMSMELNKLALRIANREFREDTKRQHPPKPPLK